MTEMSWVRTLAALQDQARRYPGMVLGPADKGHLQIGILDPLRHMWERRAFLKPLQASIVVSPSQYHFKGFCGPLLGQVERLVDWEAYDVLLQAFSEIGSQLDKLPQGWARRLSGSTFGFGSFVGLLPFADRGVVAIRTSAGLWCQAYESGWPTSPTFRAKDADPSIGLMVAAALSSDWYKGLPFGRTAVEATIPEEVRPHVTVEWHEADDLVPACAVDPKCVLHPQNIGRWL